MGDILTGMILQISTANTTLIAIGLDALMHSLQMLPLLFVIFIGVAWVEQRFNTIMHGRLLSATQAGPALGALFGSVPQCGFSVMGSVLYARGYISTGTLLAVFLATSDEAIPVILSQTDRIADVMPLLLVKIGVALVAGYTVDLCTRRRMRVPTTVPVPALTPNGTPTSEPVGEPDPVVETHGCCDHDIAGGAWPRTYLLHPLLHTLKIFAFVFVITFAFNALVHAIGEANLHRALLQGSLWQPMITGVVGLIPNCAASIAIAELYLQGGIGFGSTISGLGAAAGLGILVLFKENGNLRDTLRILGLLLFVSIVSGIIIQLVYG